MKISIFFLHSLLILFSFLSNYKVFFDRLSQMNADYDSRECNRLYDNCMKGNKGGITIATFFQMARDLANVDLKEMARERGKREEKCPKCPKCPTVPLSQINNKKCNKKDNILISKTIYYLFYNYKLELILFPFNCSRWFRSYIIHNTIYMVNFIYNS